MNFAEIDCLHSYEYECQMGYWPGLGEGYLWIKYCIMCDTEERILFKSEFGKYYDLENPECNYILN